MKRKILVCGLPGSGKTTLAKVLAPMLGAVLFDGDAVRQITGNWDFHTSDRLIQAAHMSWLCDQVITAGHTAIAAFICPTGGTRAVFGADFMVFCDRIIACPYPDTNALWVPPSHADYTVTPEGSAEWHAIQIYHMLKTRDLDKEIEMMSTHLPSVEDPNVTGC